MLHELTLRTRARTEIVDITADVQRIIARSGVREGLCHIFVPHTTAGVTVNEKADPDVTRDLDETLSRLVPEGDEYRHAEGNAHAHVKSTLTGVSALVPVSEGGAVLGTWQAIFFCEFDGPRTRRCLVRVIDADAHHG